jgi:hypothetical protein
MVWLPYEECDGKMKNPLLSGEVKDWWIALLTALSIWLKSNGLIPNTHTLSILLCNLGIAAWKYPSRSYYTVWDDVKTSGWIPGPPWLMTPKWLVNLCNDQVAIKDKTMLTFSKLEEHDYKWSNNDFLERQPHRWKIALPRQE